MEATQRVAEMAGYFLGHALWSVSDGEVLVPILGYLKADDSRSMQRLAMGSIQAVATGERRINALQPDERGAVFIKDALVTLPTGKTDCLSLDIRFADGGQRQLQYLLPYRNAAHASGFAVHRLKVSQWHGLSMEEVDAFTQALFDGLNSHEQGGALWRDVYVDQAGESAQHQGEENSRFDPDEFQLLRRVPFLVFFLVAASDGKVDRKEIAAFGNQLVEADKYADPLLTRIVTNVVNDVAPMVAQVLEQPPEFATELRQARALVDARISPEAGRRFGEAVLAMARDVASASGGFFGFGSRISRTEQLALAVIADSLGVA